MHQNIIRFPFSRTLKNYIRGRSFSQSLKTEGWIFSSYRANIILNELSNWQAFYLPIDIRNKTVLDVGAGEGETAKFFLEHGAKKVVCLESDVESYKNLYQNSKRFRGIEPLNASFSLKHLYLDFDFLKMDIEGYEEVLLTTELTKPAVIEVHGLQLRDQFKNAMYRITYGDNGCEKGFGCFSYAYWRC